MMHSRYRHLMPIILVILTGFGLYGLLPQLGNFQDSLKVLHRTRAIYVLAALLAVFMSYLLSAVTYYLLSLKPLRFKPTLLVELAGLLVNRILPAGIGGLSLNYTYLRARKHSGVQATAVVGINNVLGLLGHVLLTAAVLIWQPQTIAKIHVTHMHLVGIVVLVALILLLLAVLLGRRFADRFKKVVGSLQYQLQVVLRYYGQRPATLLAALLASGLLTLANVYCLWFCCLALHLSLSFAVVFVVFTFGVAAGTAAPTPGGIGGVEAGLVGGLVAFGVDGSQALAVTLVYRLVSFWLGLAIGGGALLLVRQRQLLK